MVCVTTGILRTLTAEELEGVLAHELSHVAHRDVAGDDRRLLGRASWPGWSPGCAVRGARSRRSAATTTTAARIGFFAVLVVSLVVYAISFLLLRLLSRYRELCADRAGAYLTRKPSALAIALTQDQRRDERRPRARPARGPADERLLLRARPSAASALGTLTSTHPPLEQRLDQLAKISADLGQTR